MLAALEAAQSSGVDVAPLDVWSRDGGFDILHLWGLEESHLPTIIWAKKAGKKIVMTVLLPYVTKIAFTRYMVASVLGLKRKQRRMLNMVDHLIVVNNDQAKTAERFFCFPKNRMSVIPNIVDHVYFFFDKGDSGLNQTGLNDYLVCTGNICARKNQLNLAHAAIAENIPLIIVGKVLPGEESYSRSLASLVKESNIVKWIPGLPVGSSEMHAVYRFSKGFALVSHAETQPISALEAAAMRKPLILSDSEWARQRVYSGACLVDPKSVNSIRSGIRRLYRDPDKFVVLRDCIEACRKSFVGDSYASAYREAMMLQL